MEVKEGFTSRLDNNNWFQQNIKPKAKRAFVIEAEDGFHYQLVRTENPETGRTNIVVLKVTSSGFIKSVMSLSPALASKIAELLQELAK